MENGSAPRGREVNVYTLIERIGTGGMSTVWRARARDAEEDVAIKVIGIDELDPEFERRLRREPEIHRRLEHESIVGLIDWFREGEEFFLVMEYVPGESLSARVKREGPLGFVEARDMMRGVLRAVAHLHEHDVIHRDIKPGNILLRPDGSAVLTDFGIAKFGWQQGETKTQAGLGTPEYMSPEQVRGSAIDYRTDIWSLGITLYEVLTGRKPFSRQGSGETPAEYAGVISRIMAGELPDPRIHNPKVPDGAIRVINNALALQQEDRYGSAAEMLGALEVVDPRIVSPLPDDDATLVLAPEDRAGVMPQQAELLPATGRPENRPVPPSDPVPQRKKSGRAGLWITLFLLLAAAGSYAAWHLTDGFSGGNDPSGTLTDAEALGIARGVASDFERYSFDGNVNGLTSLYAERDVDFYRLKKTGQREIADDYNRFFAQIVETRRLDVEVRSATPLTDTSLLSRWRVHYEREKEDGTILRGLSVVDVTIAWVGDRWAIIAEKQIEIVRNDEKPLPPPDLSDLDSAILPDIDLDQELSDAVDAEIPEPKVTAAEMKSAVGSIVGMINNGEANAAWSRYASNELKGRVGGFPAQLSVGTLTVQAVTTEGETAIATLSQENESVVEEYRLRLTFEKTPELKITSVTPIR